MIPGIDLAGVVEHSDTHAFEKAMKSSLRVMT